MRFIADSNVGRLGRWLRIAGFDTVCAGGIDDNRLVRIALDEDRVLLTRDTHILERRVVTSGRLKVILIHDDQPRAQLGQVLATLELADELNPFSRCVECNASLRQIEKEQVQGMVPPYVYRTQAYYMQCPGCGRVYWRGTHWVRMKEDLERVAGKA
jgi:uncharacterized protein with PIN domain